MCNELDLRILAIDVTLPIFALIIQLQHTVHGFQVLLQAETIRELTTTSFRVWSQRSGLCASEQRALKQNWCALSFLKQFWKVDESIVLFGNLSS